MLMVFLCLNFELFDILCDILLVTIISLADGITLFQPIIEEKHFWDNIFSLLGYLAVLSAIF